jgi:molybdenum cofactor biosynthesis enzyme MoaA
MDYSLELNITNYCQAKCRTCRRTVTDTGETVPWLVLKHMSDQELDHIVSKTMGLNMTYDLCGEYGDPMMHPNIQKIIDKLTSIGSVSINTNGGLRNEKFYSTNAKNRRLKITWSIDGLDHDTNWKYREGVNWQRAMDNMTAWFHHGGKGRWEYLMFDWNKDQIPLAKTFADANNISVRFKWHNGVHGQIDERTRKQMQSTMQLS